MRVGTQAAGLALVTAATVPGLMSTFLPPLHELREVRRDQVDEVRRGELHGAALSLGLGAGASLLSESPWPFLVALAMVGYLLYLYETPITTREATTA